MKNIKTEKKSIINIINNRDKKIIVDNGTVKEIKRQKKIFEKGDNVLKFPFLQRRKLVKDAKHSYIITMFFNNGTDKTFIISTPNTTFKMDKGLFYLDFNQSHFDLSLNQYHLYYTEESPVPINRNLTKQGEIQYFMVRPDSLKDLINFEYVKVLTGAHSIEDNIKKLFFFIILNMVLTGIGLFLTYNLGKQ